MTRADPLFDTLFRSTAVPSAVASAAPVREAGTRSRAGNAMGRTRAALLDGARRAVAMSGTKITMAQVAASAGVAKATLYNHFRTREAVLAALVTDEVTRLVTALTEVDRPVADVLADAATVLGQHPLLRSLARLEPGVLAELARINPSAEGWRMAEDAVAAALARDSRTGTETVLRWLASFMISPGSPADAAAGAAALLDGLPVAAQQSA